MLGQVLMPGPVLHLAGTRARDYDGVPAIGEHTWRRAGPVAGDDLGGAGRARRSEVSSGPADSHDLGGRVGGGSRLAAVDSG